jgi:hypothetical protein
MSKIDGIEYVLLQYQCLSPLYVVYSVITNKAGDKAWQCKYNIWYGKNATKELTSIDEGIATTVPLVKFIWA